MEVRGWEGRGEAVGGGRIQIQGNSPPSTPSSSFSPNNEGWCMDRVSKVSAVASGP